MKAAALVLLWASAAAAQPGAGNEEAHNVRLVDFHDLAVRSACQPTIKRSGSCAGLRNSTTVSYSVGGVTPFVGC